MSNRKKLFLLALTLLLFMFFFSLIAKLHKDGSVFEFIYIFFLGICTTQDDDRCQCPSYL